MIKKPEILAPAGDMTSVRVALDAGADAVYLGSEDFNMRQGASRHFSKTMITEASQLCRSCGAKLYLTLNTIIFENELSRVEEIIRDLNGCVDAVIASDWAVISACKKHNMPFHISTQMSCSNSESALFLKSQGATRIVLARECTLPEIRAIIDKTGIEVETFVHGAMCVAVSGRCLLSHDAYGRSGSRGECLQPCRRKYHVREIQQDQSCNAEFEVTPHTIFSARDLCSIAFVDQLMTAGITSFKIEGRARNPEYVQVVTSAYKRAVEAVANNRFTAELVAELERECAKVYHREYGYGLFHGRPGQEQLTSFDANLATTRKVHAGVVRKYYKRPQVAEIYVQNNTVYAGEKIAIHGETSGIVELRSDAMEQDGVLISQAGKGDWFTILCEKRVRENDKVYIIRDAETAGSSGSD